MWKIETVLSLITWAASIKKFIPKSAAECRFHHCGIPLLALKFSNYKDVLIEANRSDEKFITIEERYYQTNHAVLGYYVASSWHLPKEICQLILQHHDNSYLFSDAEEEYKIAYAALKAADNMVERAKRFSYSEQWQESEEQLLNILGITVADYADLEDDFAEFF